MPDEAQIADAKEELTEIAVAPLASNVALRNALIETAGTQRAGDRHGFAGRSAGGGILGAGDGAGRGR